MKINWQAVFYALFAAYFAVAAVGSPNWKSRAWCALLAVVALVMLTLAWRRA